MWLREGICECERKSERCRVTVDKSQGPCESVLPSKAQAQGNKRKETVAAMVVERQGVLFV